MKPSLSKKILLINNITNKLLSKLHSDLYKEVYLKDTKKFGSEVINRQFFHRKMVFHMKILSIYNFTNKLLNIKDYFLNGPLCMKFTMKFGSKVINRQYFHRKTGLLSKHQKKGQPQNISRHVPTAILFSEHASLWLRLKSEIIYPKNVGGQVAMDFT